MKLFNIYILFNNYIFKLLYQSENVDYSTKAYKLCYSGPI
jgi:hypothetical protein